MKVSCIIVEDQRPAQKILEKYIDDTPELKLSGTFNNALEAATYLKSNTVELVFLDIHLPKLSGIDFLKIIPNPPKVIFTTAFPDYALTGFELNAIDYLLKPFDFSRFYQAVSKFINQRTVEIENIPTTNEKNHSSYYFARLDRELIKINFEEIYYVQASGDFVNIFLRDKKILLSENLKVWEGLLVQNHFCKVHKSYIINIRHIDRVVGNIIHINNGQIPIGRSFKKSFMDQINS